MDLPPFPLYSNASSVNLEIVKVIIIVVYKYCLCLYLIFKLVQNKQLFTSHFCSPFLKFQYKLE